MSVEFDRESPGKFDSSTLIRETLSRWTGRMHINATKRIIGQKRLQTPEDTQRKQGDNTHQRQSDTWYRPVFSESLLGFGVSSGEFMDEANHWHARRQA